MKWRFKEKQVEELEITLEKAVYDDEVQAVMTYLEKYEVLKMDVIPIKTADRLHLVKVTSIIAVEVNGDQLEITTREGIFKVRERLFRFKEKLSSYDFLQVSKQSLININDLKSLEASFSGNMLALMGNGMKVSVSRRFLKDLEKRLGLR